MPASKSWEREHGFLAFFLNREHPERLGVREIAVRVKKEYGADLSKNTIARAIAEINESIQTDSSVKSAYEQWKSEQNEKKKFFWKFNADGKIESPYEEVRRKADRVFTKKGRYPNGFIAQLQMAEKFWQSVGRKSPEDWNEDDYNAFIANISDGSKFNATVAIRAFGKKLADIDGLTLGLKPEARRPAILASKDFPRVWQMIINKVLELARARHKPEEIEEIEFVLRVKPKIGIRTGEYDQRDQERKGLWGTKIGGQEKLRKGLIASHIQVVGKHEFIWEVLEKRDEQWRINFIDDKTRDYIINYVKKRKIGDYLLMHIAPVDVNDLLKEACKTLSTSDLQIDELRLHDMRKIYVSMLVRAGIPLEKAIRLNVGWLDIGTAYKHYLMFADLGEDEERIKGRFADLFKEEEKKEGS